MRQFNPNMKHGIEKKRGTGDVAERIQQSGIDRNQILTIHSNQRFSMGNDSSDWTNFGSVACPGFSF
jgi:hypothetical protein